MRIGFDTFNRKAITRTTLILFIVIIAIVSTIGVVAIMRIGVSPIPTLSNVELANETIGGYPGNIDVNTNFSKIYVSDLFANKLTALNASTGAILDTIQLPGTASAEIAIDQKNNVVYAPVAGCINDSNATNSCSSNSSSITMGGIVKINGNDDSIMGEIPIYVNELVFNQNTETLYGISSNHLLAINSLTDELIGNISLNEESVSFALNPKTNVLYVAVCQLSLACGNAELLKINGTSLNIMSIISLSNFDAINFPVIINLNTNTVYVLGESGASMTLVVIDGNSFKVEYSSNIASSCAGAGGGTLAISSESNKLYAAFAGQSYFLVIDLTDGHVVNMVGAGNGLQSVAFDSNTSRIYLTMENSQNLNLGYLLTLPSLENTSYVDTSLLPRGTCVP